MRIRSHPPRGEFIAVHQPLTVKELAVISAKQDFALNVPRPSNEDFPAGQAHAAYTAALEAPLHDYEDQDQIARAHGGALHHPDMAEINAEQHSQQSDC